MNFLDALNTPWTAGCTIAILAVLWLRDVLRLRARRKRREAEAARDAAQDVEYPRRAWAQHFHRSQTEHDDRWK